MAGLCLTGLPSTWLRGCVGAEVSESWGLGPSSLQTLVLTLLRDMVLSTPSKSRLEDNRIAEKINETRGDDSVPHPEGSSTKYLRTLVPNTKPLMVLGIRVFKYWLLGPSGHM